MTAYDEYMLDVGDELMARFDERGPLGSEFSVPQPTADPLPRKAIEALILLNGYDLTVSRAEAIAEALKLSGEQVVTLCRLALESDSTIGSLREAIEYANRVKGTLNLK